MALYGGCEYFCKRVAEVTDNKFRSSRSPPAKIVPGLQVLDAVGTARSRWATRRCTITGQGSASPSASLPFGLNTRAHIAWLHFGGGPDSTIF